MKKIEKYKFFSGVVVAFFFLMPFFCHAQSYTPMESFPGFDSSQCGTDATTCFEEYISSIYNFGIWTVGVAAMFMIMWGGFTYFAAAGNASKVDTGKKIIKDALLGLVVALTAWLILNVINPDLVTGSIDVAEISCGGDSGISCGE